MTDHRADPTRAAALKASNERFDSRVAAAKLLPPKQAEAAYRRAVARRDADTALLICGASDRILQD
jgi:hypothetical protein